MRSITAFVAAIVLAVPLPAEDVRIVLWNAEELFDVGKVADREDDLKEFAETTMPDVLLID